VSGQCGRLKCCLVYEEANYVEAAKSLPRMGKRVETPDGVGRVGDLDVLRGRVRVLFPDGPPKVYEGSAVRALAIPGGGGPGGAARPPEPPERDDDENANANRNGDGDGDGSSGNGGSGTPTD
jgi:hypothetical protein